MRASEPVENSISALPTELQELAAKVANVQQWKKWNALKDYFETSPLAKGGRLERYIHICAFMLLAAYIIIAWIQNLRMSPVSFSLFHIAPFVIVAVHELYSISFCFTRKSEYKWLLAAALRRENSIFIFSPPPPAEEHMHELLGRRFIALQTILLGVHPANTQFIVEAVRQVEEETAVGLAMVECSQPRPWKPRFSKDQVSEGIVAAIERIDRIAEAVGKESALTAKLLSQTEYERKVKESELGPGRELALRVVGRIGLWTAFVILMTRMHH